VSEEKGGLSRRNALRLFLGRGSEIARERDQKALAEEQRTALEGAQGAVAPTVERLDEGAADEIVSALADAFRGYPVMRFVLGDDDEERLHTLVRIFVMGRVMRGEPLLGVRHAGELIAAAIASFPDGSPAPPAFLALRAELWERLGASAQRRYDAYVAAASGFPFDFPHVHLNMVGVRPGVRGSGHARRLIDEVRRISRERPGSEGVTLTTEDPTNVPFYQKLGFNLVGQVRVVSDLTTWGFVRRDPT
jgi:ribosomal protein S18 acetylase RimI-like enzyme